MNKGLKGFTLVEMMISLLLSMVIIAAIGKVFVESRDGFRKQKALSYLVQDGRYAMDLLGKEFRRTGFLNNRLNLTKTAETLFINDENVLGSGVDFSTGESIHGVLNNEGFEEDIFDINHIVFRYQLKDSSDLGNGKLNYNSSSCAIGIGLAAYEDPEIEDTVVSLYFYIQFSKTANTSVLYCRAKRINLSDRANAKKNKIGRGQPLISNVEKLSILYGIDTSGNGDANQYLTANQVTEDDWKNVTSVRVHLVLASEERQVTNDVPKYKIEGITYEVNSPDDKRLYRVFSSTFTIRN